LFSDSQNEPRPRLARWLLAARDQRGPPASSCGTRSAARTCSGRRTIRTATRRGRTHARSRMSTSGEIPASQDQRYASRTEPGTPMSLSVRDGMGDIREEAPAGTSRAGAASASQRAPIREKAPAAVHPYSRVVDPLL